MSRVGILKREDHVWGANSANSAYRPCETDTSLLGRQESVAKTDRLFFFLCLMDIFFLPYFWAVTVPYSMPIVLIWFFIRYSTVSETREFPLFRLIMFFMGFSTVLSFFLAPLTMYKNSTLLIELCTMFIYYFMFAYYVDRYPTAMKAFLVGFVIFVAVFSTIYMIDKSVYQQMKYIWNPRMGTVWNTTVFTGYRFGFFWMDENNIGYAVTAVVLFLLCNETTSFFTKVTMIGCMGFIVISCMSNGSTISALISLGLYFCFRIVHFLQGKITLRFRLTNVVLFFILLLILYFLIPQIPQYLHDPTVEESFARMEINTPDSRFSIWKTILQDTNFVDYLLLGRGGNTIINGVKVNPHNGHFFWVLAYGLIAYLIFIVIFFRKRKITSFYQYLFMIPLWIGFTINILIGELKFSAILALLVACSSSPRYILKNKKIDREMNEGIEPKKTESLKG